MRSYTVHRRRRTIGDPAAEAASTLFVREGFSWPAFLVPPLWLLYHRMWLVLGGFVLAAVAAGLVLGTLDLSGTANLIAVVILLALFAADANELRRWTLTRRGYDLVAVVLGRDLVEAETRYFRNWHAAMIAHQEARDEREKVSIAFRQSGDDPGVGLFPEGGPA